MGMVNGMIMIYNRGGVDDIFDFINIINYGARGAA